MDNPVHDLRVSLPPSFFGGFLWAYLYSGISLKVFSAPTSLVPCVPSGLVKSVYVVAALLFMVGSLHLFTSWTGRVVMLEESLSRRTTLADFAVISYRVLGRGFYFALALSGFIISTYVIFPDSGISVYEVLFATLLWPLWMLSVITALFDRLARRLPHE